RGADALIAGAREASGDGIALRVFGDAPTLAALAALDGVEVVEAPDEITNADEPVGAVRSRERASVVLAAADVAAGRSDALVSAGPTGATMAASTFALRR